MSFAWWDELLAVQDGLSSFVLASVDFTVTGNGSGTIGLSNTVFGDDFGDAFTNVSASNQSYSVTSGNPVDVPEPATLILVLMALALLVRQQKMS